jgi:cytochrome P450
MTTKAAPVTDIDLFSDEGITAPHDLYRELREAGPAVWMSKYDAWVLPRYRDVYDALRNHETFSSAQGPGLSDEVNRLVKGTNVIGTDPPIHDDIRALAGQPLSPKAMRTHRDHIQNLANDLVDRLVEVGSFDGVRDFAQVLPVSVVPDLIGWPTEGRDQLLEWGSAVFDAIGPMNDRTRDSLPSLQGMVEYTSGIVADESFVPGGWGERLLRVVKDSPVVSDDRLPAMVIDYLAPSLDTTISALASAIWLFGAHPEQWRLVRENPALIPNAFNEIVRLETPLRGFTRSVTQTTSVGDSILNEGDRVMLLWASANRDERQFQDPDSFDVTRDNASEHVGFGHGIHNCMGQGLARLEGHSLLNSLVSKVQSIEVGEPEWLVHNIVRGIESLPVTLRT